MKNATVTPLPPRIQALLERFRQARPEVFPERAVLVTRSYTRTEGQPALLRRAQMMADILDEVAVLIREGELIVGCKTPAILGSPLYPEIACSWIEDELDTIALRAEAPFHISEETKNRLRSEVLGYWQGKQVHDRIVEHLPAEVLEAADEGLLFHYFLNRSIGHITVDYARVFGKGFQGLKEEAQQELRRVDLAAAASLKKVQLLRAMIICCDAAVRFGERYAAEAERLAALEDDMGRRGELKEIANSCRRVPARPARSFREALQSFWFVHLMLNLESNGYAIGPGRFDQYLYPFYAADLEAGDLSQEEAFELVASLWIKLNELTVVKEGGTAKASTTYNDFQNLNLGGVTAQGLEATNDLSSLCLEVTEALRLPQPQVSALISTKTPDRFLARACQVIERGFGMPAVFNDDVKVEALLDKGKTLEDARLGGINGCVEISVQGKDNMASSGYLNLTKCLELALNDGVNPVTGRRLGPRTGKAADLESWARFLEAYRRQLRHAIGLKMIYDSVARQIYAQYCPVPLTSLLVSDCMEKGQDFHDGGGGLYSKNQLHLINCTVVNNYARATCAAGQMDARCPHDEGGGGVYVRATLHMTNSIIANNRKEDCGLAAPGTYGEIEGGRIGANSSNWVGDGSCEAAYAGDPMLGPLTDNGGGTLTHLPLPGSPAIDMLPAAACSLVIDQRGLPRPAAVTSAGTLCDLGATEVQGNE